MMRSLWLIILLFAQMLSAEPIRLGYWKSDLSQKGPGLLIKKCEEQEASLLEIATRLKQLDLDILVLSGVDQDPAHWFASCFSKRIGLQFYYSGATNLGLSSGYDLNGDGRFGAEDRFGYGHFFGQGGMVIFSKTPINNPVNFSKTKWKDVPDAKNPTIGGHSFYSEEIWQIIPLHPAALWVVDILGIQFVTLQASTPALDGAANENGLRNRAELTWLRGFLAGETWPDDLGQETSLRTPYLFLGTLNVDMVFGDGDKAALIALLTHPKINILSSPAATASWPKYNLPPMRVDYVLSSCGFNKIDEGQLDFLGHDHKLLWLEVERVDCNLER